LKKKILIYCSLISLFSICNLLAACSQPASAVVYNKEHQLSTIQFPNEQHKTPKIRARTDTPTEEAIPLITSLTIELAESAEATRIVSTASHKIEKTPTLEINPVPFQVCSPLEQVQIGDLSKIISAPYQPPPMGDDTRHQGVDFCYHRWNGTGPIHGVIVQAVISGRVAASLKDTFPYGNLVIIETPIESIPQELTETLKLPPGLSLYVLYAHLDGPAWVKLGQEVTLCQHVGLVGKSGNAAVPHLHLEIRTGTAGTIFTGLSRFTEHATSLEKENYLLWRTSGIFLHFDPMWLFEFSDDYWFSGEYSLLIDEK
jgi:murein DD-endopeptidase MepM/ murein hydrolase activator NlpD